MRSLLHAYRPKIMKIMASSTTRTGMLQGKITDQTSCIFDTPNAPSPIVKEERSSDRNAWRRSHGSWRGEEATETFRLLELGAPIGGPIV